MAKVKTFADKIAKDKLDFTKHCPVCGESFSMVKLVSSEPSDKEGAWKFREKIVGVCKCNEQEILG